MKFLTSKMTLLALLFFTCVIAGFGVWQVQTNPQFERTQTQRIDRTSYTEQIKREQIPVTIGVYPLTVYHIDTAANTYQMTAYLWMKWKGDITPDKSLEIMNIVDTTSYTQTVINTQKLADGSTYTLYKIDGTFFESFDMAKFPVDNQQLSLVIEDSYNTTDQIRYVADVQQSNPEMLKIPGWEFRNLQFVETESVYHTNFGFVDGETESHIPQLQFNINIQRPILFYLIKFVFPLSLILLVNYIVFWMPYAFMETVIFIIAGTLLSIMFVQQLYMGKTENQQLVLIDYIYLYAYVSTFLTIITKMYFYNKIEAGWEEENALVWDRVIFSVHYVTYVLLIFWVFVQYFTQN